MAFTFRIESCPEADQYIEDKIKAAQRNGKYLSKHQAVIQSILREKQNQEFIEDLKTKNDRLMAENLTLKSQVQVVKQFKDIVNNI